MLIIIDLDDTIANTTQNLGGDISRLGSLTLVDGALDFLDKYGSQTVLLTSGAWFEQERKISVLGIRSLLKSTNVVHDTEKKMKRLAELVKASNLDPSQVVIVGDRLDLEIQKGNELGCFTVRMRLEDAKYAAQEPTLVQTPFATVQNFYQLMLLPIFGRE